MDDDSQMHRGIATKSLCSSLQLFFRNFPQSHLSLHILIVHLLLETLVNAFQPGKTQLNLYLVIKTLQVGPLNTFWFS